MFRLKPASEFVGRYHSDVSCAFKMEDQISNIFLNSESNKEISNKF
jgi:hypothetical protein